jgi:regulator of sigma D
MLDNCTDMRERWHAVESLLQGWLKERRNILVEYAGIASTIEQNPDSIHSQQHLQRLCEVLVDYVSAGHFEIFHELIREAEVFGDGSDQLATTILPQITDTTEVILGFDEKYPLPEDVSADYTADLSLLGEMLERRFELEDKLIIGLHKAHAVLVGQSSS